MAELLALQAEYARWLTALPDSLRDTPTAEALEALANLDLTPSPTSSRPAATVVTDRAASS